MQGKLLKIAIAADGRTHSKIARAARVGRFTLSRLAGGHQIPTQETADKIARALGVRTRDIFPVVWGEL